MDTLAQHMVTGVGDLVQATAGRMDALAQQTTASVAAMAQQISAGLDALAQKNATSTQTLAATWQTHMEALRADEQRRGDAAVARLGELQARRGAAPGHAGRGAGGTAGAADADRV
jgi:predicted chitinase